MPLTAEDVVRKTFSQALFRGYVTTEVDGFLEEVVSELQRLTSLVDELRAAQLTGGHAESDEERRARIETAQLEQVRKERAELVREIAQLQERYDRLRAETGELADQGSSRS